MSKKNRKRERPAPHNPEVDLVEAKPTRPPHDDTFPSHLVAAKYEGPLPLPAHLREYEEAVPGAGKIILAEFQKQGPHRRDMEKIGVRAETRDMLLSRLIEVLGYFCAVVVVGGILAAGVYIATRTDAGTWDKVFGASLSATGLAGVAAVFIGGRDKSREDAAGENTNNPQ